MMQFERGCDKEREPQPGEANSVRKIMTDKPYLLLGVLFLLASLVISGCGGIGLIATPAAARKVSDPNPTTYACPVGVAHAGYPRHWMGATPPWSGASGDQPAWGE